MDRKRLKLTTVGNDDLLGSGARLGAEGLDLLDDIHACGDIAEDDVLAIEPVGLDGTEEELGTVGAWTSVGHGENTWAGVLELEVLILELGAVNGLATGSVARGEVTTLQYSRQRSEGVRQASVG